MPPLLTRLADYFGAHQVEDCEAHERDRARQRVGIGAAVLLAVGGHALVTGRPDPLAPAVLALAVAYIVLALAHQRWVIGHPRYGPVSQYLLILTDSALTVFCLAGAPQVLGALYPVMIIQIVRCGMRYGIRTLWLAWAAAAATAALTLPFSPYWQQETQLRFSFIVTMAVIPLLMGPLVRRLHEASAALRTAADTDPLTGAGNRRQFEARLATTLEACRRDGRMFALLLLDLDHFKRVNDVLGHDRGDELLVRVTAVLRARIRPGDFVGRLGGDEFVLLLGDLPPQAGPGRVESLATGLVDELRTLAEQLAPGQGVSASVGVACWHPQDGAAPEPEELLRRADQAMYAVKRMRQGLTRTPSLVA